MKAYVTIGCSASGKTTWAKEQHGFSVICRDDVRRFILENEGKLLQYENLWSKWNFKREKEVTEIYWKHVDDMARIGNNIILADTNLNPNRREEMKRRLESLGYEVEFKEFPIDYETAVKRDLNRRDSVGTSVIWKQYKELYGEVYVPPKDAPKAVIVDIDGTLAHMVDRGPFDWSKVGQDKFDETVATVIEGFRDTYHDVIVLSGRDSVCRNETQDWLTNHQFWYNHLYMRAEGDMRKDSTVKRELFDKYIKDKYNVVAVFDDRPQMVRLWNLMGLKTFAVADPYLGF